MSMLISSGSLEPADPRFEVYPDRFTVIDGQTGHTQLSVYLSKVQMRELGSGLVEQADNTESAIVHRDPEGVWGTVVNALYMFGIDKAALSDDRVNELGDVIEAAVADALADRRVLQEKEAFEWGREYERVRGSQTLGGAS